LLDKNAPFSGNEILQPCSCGRRFIDEVFAHLYRILREAGVFSGSEPLKAVGTPLVHPGFAMTAPPFLPARSLVLVSRAVTPEAALRMAREVPEIRGVVRTGDFIPGVTDPDLAASPRTYELLAGCDVRADVFLTGSGPLVLYKQQSMMHIEFPRPKNPKIVSVEQSVRAMRPGWFVDACSGAGTLGLTAARMGVPHVLCNDAWFAAAFWTACNLSVNRALLQIGEVQMLTSYEALRDHPVGRYPLQVAKTTGEQDITVYHGDYRELHNILPPCPVLAALDIFEKSDQAATGEIIENWRRNVTGEVFIP
jgi:hypothetical protein